MRARVRNLILLLAALSAGGIAATTAPGCSSDSDVNFTCTPNVTKDGIKVVTNGCDDFAVCKDSSGNPQDPARCCTGLSGSDLSECLYGYGAGSDAAGGGGSGGSPTTSITPTSGGSDASGGSGGTGGKSGSGGKG